MPPEKLIDTPVCADNHEELGVVTQHLPLSPQSQALLSAREALGISSQDCFTLVPIYEKIPRIPVDQYLFYIANRQFPYQVYGQRGSHDRSLHVIPAIEFHPQLVDVAMTGAQDGVRALRNRNKNLGGQIGGAIDRFVSTVGTHASSVNRILTLTGQSNEYSPTELESFCRELEKIQIAHSIGLRAMAATLL